jgi:hypothetical protein
MYAVLSMIFTIGYGDAVPISNFERVIFLVIMIVGVIIYSLLTTFFVKVLFEPTKDYFY